MVFVLYRCNHTQEMRYQLSMVDPDELPDVGESITLERLESILGFIVKTDGADRLEINIGSTRYVFLRQEDGKLRRDE